MLRNGVRVAFISCWLPGQTFTVLQKEQETLRDDDDLKEAVKILTAPEKYKEMLSAPAVTSMSLQQRKETAPVFLSTATRANEHVYDEIV